MERAWAEQGGQQGLDGLAAQVERALAANLDPPRWSPALRKRFEDGLAARQYNDNRYLLTLGLVIVFLSIPIDFLTIPDHAPSMVMARLAIVLPLQVIGLLVPLRMLAVQKIATGLSVIAFAAILLAGAQWAPPITGAYMAIGPVILLGIATPMLPFTPREVLIFVGGFAVALVVVVIAAGGPVMRDPAYLGILAITLAVSALLPRRLWALTGRNFLLAQQAGLRLAELGEANAQLAEMSRRDPLTGLANRRHASETFAEHFASKTASGQASSALMMLDLDRFKAFNDRYGHQTGDDCLRAVAEQMRHVAARHGGLAARFGGEEFVILYRALDQAEALATAEELRRKIETIEIPHADDGDTATCSTSIGVALHKDEGPADLATLLRRADSALYEAKNAGRNRVEVAA